MTRGDVTALTDHRHARVQHAVVRRAVRVVAGHAALADRRVLPQHRPAHLGVTGRQLSFTELPTLRALTLAMEPCGLWHDEQLILPSRTGMCATARSVFTTCTMADGAHLRLGRLRQVMLHGLRVVHAVTRRARQIAPSCVLPSHAACAPRLWQVRQV